MISTRALAKPTVIAGALAVAFFAAGGLAGYWLLGFWELDGKEGKYLGVIGKIEAGTIKPGGKSPVKLPAQYGGITPMDEVYVEKRPGGKLLVLFPTWYGRGSDVEGFLYCSQPLGPADFYQVDWGVGGKHEHLDVGEASLLTVKRHLRGPWHKAGRRLD